MVESARKVRPEIVQARLGGATPGRIAAFCRARGIRWLALFGSVLRDDFHPDSDIDMLVEFGPDHQITFLDLHAMEAELSHLTGGRRIELVTVAALHRLIRTRALATAEVLYAEG